MRAGTHTLRRGFLWLGSASLLARLIDLAAIVTVLRFVSAEEVGAGSIAWTVTTIAEPFASLGASFAVLTVRRLDRRTIDQAFLLSLAGALMTSSVLVLCAVPIARLFGQPSLSSLIAVAALKLVPNGLCAVPQQRLARALKQREIAAANAVATVSAALVRVLLAMSGRGAWSFVLAQHAYAFTLLVCMWALSPFRPRLRFDAARLRDLLRLGVPSSASVAIAQCAKNLDYLFIGPWLGLGALGLYRVAFDLAMEPVVAIGDVVAKSATPTLHKLADARDRLRDTFRYAMRLTLSVSLPVALVTFWFAPSLLALSRDASFAVASTATRVLVVAALLRVALGLYTPLAQAVGRPLLALKTNIEMAVLLALSLAVCLTTLSGQLSIAAAGIAWCVALVASLALARAHFRGFFPRPEPG